MAHQKLEFANKGIVKDTKFCWFKTNVQPLHLCNIASAQLRDTMHFPYVLVLLFMKYLASDWRQNVQKQMTQLSITEKGEKF